MFTGINWFHSIQECFGTKNFISDALIPQKGEKRCIRVNESKRE